MVQESLNMGASEQSAARQLSASAGSPMQPRYFETVIIGTGFSGLLAAIRLQKRQCNDFVLLERNSELGGTWQANSYPGAEVDVPDQPLLHLVSYPFRSGNPLPRKVNCSHTRNTCHRQVRFAQACPHEPDGNQARL